ncbi:MAG TPA: ABC transporter ATP-binding protein [Solirubrobacteraceae bacterium]|nr:ABC transporter ATP-binding protein [Solirubrobacteraceae bacterium]
MLRATANPVDRRGVATGGLPTRTAAERAHRVVEVASLRKAYGTTVAVEDVSFAIDEGEIFGILGPNGAGKTTTVECLSGLRVPDSGTVRVLGLDPQHSRHAVRESVGVQLQEGSMPPKLTVRELLDLFASFYTDPLDAGELLALLGLTAKRDDYYKGLSGGQKQRLSIALALIGDPKVAILDELTTGLDPLARRETWSLIEGVRDRGVTIVLVTHFMDEAERLCDRIALIDSGRVIAIDTPAGLAEREGGGNHMRFHPSRPFDDALLTALPEVDRLEHEGDRIVVSGNGDLLNAVISALATAGTEAKDVQLESATLEDAFIRLTGHPSGNSDEGGER